MDWTPAFAGETNLRHGSFSSFRRKPESSSIKDGIRCPHNYDLISKSSNYDIKTAEHMLETGRYIYVLFMCHLSVEKLLKALYEAVLRKIPPKTHNLIYLSKSIGLEIPENHLRTLESLNDLSIVTRYPEDMDALIKSFKKDRVEEYLHRTKALLRWLKKSEMLRK